MHAQSCRETDGGDEQGTASSADGVRKRWLVNNTAAPSNFSESKFQDHGLVAS